MDKMLIGWEEWCSLPSLNLPAIKAKIDTGAKTSALHAFNIHPFTEQGEPWIEFSVHPMQGSEKFVTCRAPIIDRRYIMNSGGQREQRYVIRTLLVLGDVQREIDLTLTDRGALAFRMLLGRAAMRGWVTIDPARAYCQGKLKRSQVAKLYKRTL